MNLPIHTVIKKTHHALKYVTGSLLFLIYFFMFFQKEKRKTKHSAVLLQVLKQMSTPLLTVHVALSKHCNTFPNRMVT